MKIARRGQVLIGIVAVVGLYFGVKWGQDKGFIPKKKEVAVAKSNIDINSLDSFKSKYNMTRPLRVGIVTWGGYAGGIQMNNGMAANVESEFYKKYGVLVDFVLNEDLNSSRDAWKAGEVDIMWGAVDAFPSEAATLPDNPQSFLQVDWSRGGDVIVGARGIESVNDLKGKKVAVAYGTPSHSLLLKSLEAASMKSGDITIVTTNSAPEAAQFFKAGKVDAAVVWSPDDQDCLNTVSGSSVVLSTKNASNIIADMFFAKKGFIDQHEELIKAFSEAWLVGNAMMNSDSSFRQKAVTTLSKGLNQPEDFCKTAISNVRFSTYGDNTNFFNVAGTYKGVKAEDLYNGMGELYKSVKYIKSAVPTWKSVSYSKNLSNITLSGDIHAGEGVKAFTEATHTDSTSEAISNKKVSISYPSGSFVLTNEAKTAIDNDMLPIANQFASSRIRIQGNTDDVGNPDANKVLSYKRAKSVVDYLVGQYKFNKNRFIVIGNGSKKPIADNGTEDGRAANRRTDFEVVR